MTKPTWNGLRCWPAVLLGAIWALSLSACGNVDVRGGSTGIDMSIGQVNDRSAVVWVGGKPRAAVTLVLRAGDTVIQREALQLTANGYAHVALGQLRPATHYTLALAHQQQTVIATFSTAPGDEVAAPVRFLFSGDLAGQNACRDAARGFAVFDAINQQSADFFIGLGDMIYADGSCGAAGPFDNEQIAREDQPLGDAESFRARWRYNLADPGFRKLRHAMAYVPVWDDHEIINDFGPQTARSKDNPELDLLSAGRAGFFHSNPLRPAADDPNRLYRTFRRGRHAEFFVLDTRQYRDRNETDDTGVLPKSMLGATQRQWLIDGLKASTATWKFVISSVPIAIPTGYPATAGRDGWASGDGDDGFERELYAIFDALAQGAVTNLLWLAGDVHFATGFKLQPLPGQPAFTLHELIVGPLSAGMYPSRALDTTFEPQRLFFHALDTPPETLDEALKGYNFGLIDIDRHGALRFALLDGYGEQRYELALTP
ncbi:MAG: alkaline phosphatase [Gammaproteobacteria bacterium]